MEIEEQTTIYEKYNTHVDTIRSYLGELSNQFNEIRIKKTNLVQKCLFISFFFISEIKYFISYNNNRNEKK